MPIEPVTLEGRHVRLESLEMHHLQGLTDVGLEGDVFRWMPKIVRTTEDMRTMVEELVLDRTDGIVLPFATIERESGRIVGSTRFMAIDSVNRHVEIGGTWIAPAWQRTAINTEAKFLMLQHAFETWGFIRVEFKTDSLNTRSRQAVLRIGATEEGTFRNHMMVDGGRIRHSVYFSITREEWPGIKVKLLTRLARV